MAFNTKNLHYEKQEPAFLRRLRAGNTDDRTTVSVARPRNSRLETGDDDGPTIVDERGENVTLEEYEDRLKDKPENERQDEADCSEATPLPALKEQNKGSDRTDDSKRSGQQQAHLHITTGPKKRKRPKAIENDADADAEPPVEAANKPSPSTKNSVSKAKNKRQKVKLSFDHPID